MRDSSFVQVQFKLSRSRFIESYQSHSEVSLLSSILSRSIVISLRRLRESFYRNEFGIKVKFYRIRKPTRAESHVAFGVSLGLLTLTEHIAKSSTSFVSYEKLSRLINRKNRKLRRYVHSNKKLIMS